MVKKYLHTRYRVSDLEKTVGFYRDVARTEKDPASHLSAGFEAGISHRVGE
jgi:catechol 2,3-dioxygenase-like lactoylglutathione lyase family enzyme